ncbi:MAG: phosphoribosylformylglycinamidine synthase subunit PurS [Bacteroidales bacterium]|nr:phosphoribosylformylglycinamidine synthase subunit PurS [Bacteroidales bacterium]
MKFNAAIDVMPLDNLLDPQGKAVKHTLQNLKFNNVSNVRIGKHINVEIEAKSEEEAKKAVEQICQKVLANPIMETFRIVLEKV